ncbi:MAG: fasciclin domain-containing protein [Phycisphaerales bacterium]|nr:fasciclin domain-containing protein [Phycisphaerales bacterium]
MNAFVTAIGAAALATTTLSIAGPGCSSDYSSGKTMTVGMSHGGESKKADIIDTALAAGSFNTLAAALTEADLVGALKGDGPFTVFAPTDEAFSKLPKGTVESLLKPENRDQLISILTYHVVPGEFDAKHVLGSDALKTLNGQRASVNADKGMIGNASIIKTDIECSNGIIHVIDEVIMPASSSILETATSAGSFSTLAAAIDAAGLTDALSGEGPFTVFAPTDAAFAKLPAGTVETLLKPENVEMLRSILLYHVVEGRVYSDDAINAEKAETLQGTKISIKETKKGVMINNATVQTANIDTTNGVIHVIDTVILPTEN